jgi:hypothetical protein
MAGFEDTVGEFDENNRMVEWVYDSNADGTTSEFLRREAVGDAAVEEGQRQQRLAFAMLYDVSKMDDQQKWSLDTLLACSALPPSEAQAAYFSILETRDPAFSEVVVEKAVSAVEDYVRINPGESSLLKRFAGQLEAHTPLTKNQVATVLAMLAFERTSGQTDEAA